MIKERKARLCVFSSGGGGTGNSSAARAFCRCLASNGHPCVYMNFEVLSGEEFPFEVKRESGDCGTDADGGEKGDGGEVAKSGKSGENRETVKNGESSDDRGYESDELIYSLRRKVVNRASGKEASRGEASEEEVYGKARSRRPASDEEATSKKASEEEAYRSTFFLKKAPIVAAGTAEGKRRKRGGASFFEKARTDVSSSEAYFFLPHFRDINNSLSVSGEEILKLCARAAAEAEERLKAKEGGSSSESDGAGRPLIVLDLPFDCREALILPFLHAEKTVLVTDGSRRANLKLIRLINSLPELSDLSSEQVAQKILIVYNLFSEESGELLEESEKKCFDYGMRNPEQRLLLGRLGGIRRFCAGSAEERERKISESEPIKRLMRELYEFDGRGGTEGTF